MYASQTFFLLRRSLHTASHHGPSETLKKKVVEAERKRKTRKTKRDAFLVHTPLYFEHLDTASMPMILACIGVAVLSKILMMYDDSRSQEILEAKIKALPPGQGTTRMLSREEWDAVQEMRPRTPFESRIARSNARIRTGEPIHKDDLRDWAIDTFMDGCTRAEESAKQTRYKS